VLEPYKEEGKKNENTRKTAYRSVAHLQLGCCFLWRLEVSIAERPVWTGKA